MLKYIKIFKCWSENPLSHIGSFGEVGGVGFIIKGEPLIEFLCGLKLKIRLDETLNKLKF